jgi:hypothetical protein
VFILINIIIDAIKLLMPVLLISFEGFIRINTDSKILHDDSKTNHQWLHDLYYLYICINVYYQEQFEDTK